MADETEKVREILNEVGLDDEKIATVFDLFNDMGILLVGKSNMFDRCALVNETPSGYEAEHPWCNTHRRFATHIINVRDRQGTPVCGEYVRQYGCICHFPKRENLSKQTNKDQKASDLPPSVFTFAVSMREKLNETFPELSSKRLDSFAKEIVDHVVICLFPDATASNIGTIAKDS